MLVTGDRQEALILFVLPFPAAWIGRWRYCIIQCGCPVPAGMEGRLARPGLYSPGSEKAEDLPALRLDVLQFPPESDFQGRILRRILRHSIIWYKR